MTEQDVVGIESAVGVALPAHYRQFLRDHADTLVRTRAKLDRPVLYGRPEDIIAINKGLHDNPRMIEVNEDADAWPLNYFVVGTNGGGDYWCVDLSDLREAVWLYNSEAGGVFEPAAFGSWAEYMDRLDRDLEQVRRKQ